MQNQGSYPYYCLLNVKKTAMIKANEDVVRTKPRPTLSSLLHKQDHVWPWNVRTKPRSSLLSRSHRQDHGLEMVLEMFTRNNEWQVIWTFQRIYCT